LDLQCKFYACKKMQKKNPALMDFVFKTCQEQQRDAYDNSGYGWDDNDKKNELWDKSTRFLVVEDVTSGGRPVGFIHFGFTLQGDVLDQMSGMPALKVFNIAMLEPAQRIGVGQRLMQIMELIARKNDMSFVQCMVTNESKAALQFFKKKLKGYKVDDVASYCQVELEDQEELDTFKVFSKDLNPENIKKVDRTEEAAPNVTATAVTPEVVLENAVQDRPSEGGAVSSELAEVVPAAAEVSEDAKQPVEEAKKKKKKTKKK